MLKGKYVLKDQKSKQYKYLGQKKKSSRPSNKKFKKKRDKDQAHEAYSLAHVPSNPSLPTWGNLRWKALLLSAFETH